MECACFIMEEAIAREDKSLAKFAGRIFGEAYHLGWDGEYGAIFDEVTNYAFEHFSDFEYGKWFG